MPLNGKKREVSLKGKEPPHGESEQHCAGENRFVLRQMDQAHGGGAVCADAPMHRNNRVKILRIGILNWESCRVVADDPQRADEQSLVWPSKSNVVCVDRPLGRLCSIGPRRTALFKSYARAQDSPRPASRDQVRFDSAIQRPASETAYIC